MSEGEYLLSEVRSFIKVMGTDGLLYWVDTEEPQPWGLTGVEVFIAVFAVGLAKVISGIIKSFRQLTVDLQDFVKEHRASDNAVQE